MEVRRRGSRKICSLPHCRVSKRKDPSSRVYSFPKEADRRKIWLNACKIPEWKRNLFICEKHFEKKFMGKKYLLANAVPTINLENNFVIKICANAVYEVEVKSKDSFEKNSVVETFIQRQIHTDIHVSCSVVECSNIYGLTKTYKPHVQYHSFPINRQIAQEWELLCDVSSSDLENYYVCSEHFREEDYEERAIKNDENNRIKILRPSAIPSISIRNIKSEEIDLIDTSLREDNTVLEIGTPIKRSNSDEHLFSILESDSDVRSLQTANAANTNGEKICIIKNCGSRGSLIEYYSFPTIPATRTNWLEQIRYYTNQTDINPSTALVCALHFKPECFRTDAINGNIYLLSSAVPTIFEAPARSTEQIRENRVFSISGINSETGSSQTLANDTNLNVKKSCVIKNCKSLGYNVEHYSFPSVPTIRTYWLEQIKYYTNQTDINPSTDLVCCLHFKPDSFHKNATNGSLYLLPSAVPTIFSAGGNSSNTNFPKLTEEQMRNPDEVKTCIKWFERNHHEHVARIEFLNNQLKAHHDAVMKLSRNISAFLTNTYISDEVNENLQKLADECIDAQLSIT